MGDIPSPHPPLHLAPAADSSFLSAHLEYNPGQPREDGKESGAGAGGGEG